MVNTSAGRATCSANPMQPTLEQIQSAGCISDTVTHGPITSINAYASLIACFWRLLPVAKGRKRLWIQPVSRDRQKRPRREKNAGTVLKTALIRKICRRLVDQQTKKLRRNAIFVPILTVKPALRPHCVSGAERPIASGASR